MKVGAKAQGGRTRQCWAVVLSQSLLSLSHVNERSDSLSRHGGSLAGGSSLAIPKSSIHSPTRPLSHQAALSISSPCASDAPLWFHQPSPL